MPPYCPQFQPIEMAWHLVKTRFRKEMLKAMIEEREGPQSERCVMEGIRSLDNRVLERMFVAS